MLEGIHLSIFYEFYVIKLQKFKKNGVPLNLNFEEKIK